MNKYREKEMDKKREKCRKIMEWVRMSYGEEAAVSDVKNEGNGYGSSYTISLFIVFIERETEKDRERERERDHVIRSGFSRTQF